MILFYRIRRADNGELQPGQYLIELDVLPYTLTGCAKINATVRQCHPGFECAAYSFRKLPGAEVLDTDDWSDMRLTPYAEIKAFNDSIEHLLEPI